MNDYPPPAIRRRLRRNDAIGLLLIVAAIGGFGLAVLYAPCVAAAVMVLFVVSLCNVAGRDERNRWSE